MNRHVNAIAGCLSLRPPQRRSLEILDRITEIAPPGKGADTAAVLEVIRGEFPSVADFEREFPSLCFALATGVGKTRLMGAFISYLHLAHGINHFFVLAPNLTIYNKLIADFTPNTPKYVFKGIAEFAAEPPEIITGDTYEARARTLFDETIRCKINIFNISKINSEVRGGKSPRIKRLSEYIFMPAEGEASQRHPSPPSPLLPISIGILASLGFSALLAWYLAKPIRHLRGAFDAVTAGKLETRIGPRMGRRRDEIADLGRDFDRMAQQPQILVGSQQRLLLNRQGGGLRVEVILPAGCQVRED